MISYIKPEILQCIFIGQIHCHWQKKPDWIGENSNKTTNNVRFFVIKVCCSRRICHNRCTFLVSNLFVIFSFVYFTFPNAIYTIGTSRGLSILNVIRQNPNSVKSRIVRVFLETGRNRTEVRAQKR